MLGCSPHEQCRNRPDGGSDALRKYHTKSSESIANPGPSCRATLTFLNFIHLRGTHRGPPLPEVPWVKAAMRTISKRTQYALKAMLALGHSYRRGPVLMGTLAKQENIPLKFLESILLD